MTRMDQPEIEIFNPGTQDNFSPLSPMSDNFEQRSPRRSSQRADDDLPRSFQRLDLGGKKDKVKDRRKSIDFEAGRIIRRLSSSGGKGRSRYYEFYRFEKRGADWNLADRIPMRAPQDELEKRVAKGKSRFTVLDKMMSMNALRRHQVNRLLDEKNYAEKDKDAEWVPVLIETTRQRGNSVLAFDIVIAQSFKPGGSALHDKRSSFIGEKSDLRELVKSKGKDKDKDKQKDKPNGKKGNDYENDPFDDGRVFTNDGRPIDHHGGAFEGQQPNKHPVPLEDPIAGPIPGLQPIRPPPNGWGEPFSHGDFPQDVHHNQPPVEILNDHQQPHDGQAVNGVLDLDQLLEMPPGGGGGGQPHFDQPRLENFARSGPGDSRLMGPDRQHSRERRQSGSRPRSNRIFADQGPQRRREHSHRRQYTDSSVDDEDDNSVFFNRDEGSSMSSYGDDHEHFIERRGSLKRRPSARRGEDLYREHHRRGTGYYPERGNLVIEPGWTPRRLVARRRQTIAWTEPRQITRYGRDRDFIDEALSPVLTQRSNSPAPLARREGKGPPMELYYPEELAGKNRRAEAYMDAIEREREIRYREEELRWRERELDERDRRREGKGRYRDYQDRF
jgi:hypothetical protein